MRTFQTLSLVTWLAVSSPFLQGGRCSRMGKYQPGSGEPEDDEAVVPAPFEGADDLV